MFDPNEGLLELSEVNGAVETGSTAAAMRRATQPERRYGFIPREKFDNINTGQGLRIQRFFTQPGVDPFDTVEWERRTAVIAGERGEVVFEQKDVEVPAFWSQLATNVVASKYFRGLVGTPEREHSVRQVIGRVVETLTRWGREMGYFASEQDAEAFRDELKHLLLYQYAAFNSPVWFNVGIEPRPQSSACFIVSVEDTMESILDLAKTEGMIFKFGSGSGSNLSRIRGSKEFLSGGGRASGPVSFMRGFDAFAGVIKSGGKTRRAAKMVVLNVDHPDIVDFIECKAKEEKKAWALIEQGYDPGFDTPGGAYDSVFFQNANHSVRVTDAFMRAVEQDGEWCTYARTTGEVMGRYRARELFRKIAEAAWICGDPGLQFHDTTNKWHTVKNSGPIEASNPCSEFVFLNNTSCFAPETRIATKQGLLPVAQLYQMQQAGEIIYVKTELVCEDSQHRQLAYRPAVVIKTGSKPVYRVRLSTGQQIRLTREHKVLTSKGWKQVCELQVGEDDIVMQSESSPIDYSAASPEEIAFYHLLGWMTGDGYFTDTGFGLVFGPQDRDAAEYLLPIFNRFVKSRSSLSRGCTICVQKKNGVMQIGSKAQEAMQALRAIGMRPAKATDKRVPECVFRAPKVLQAAYLGALFSADGSISLRDNHGVLTLDIRLASSSAELLRDVQVLLFDFGIRSYIGWTHPKGRKDGQGQLCLYGYQAYKFVTTIGFPLCKRKQHRSEQLISRPYLGNINEGCCARVMSIEPDGIEEVYDVWEPETHTLIAEGLIVHNCNLASLNLMKFRLPDGRFDSEAFRAAVRILITAQEIIVDNSAYPTEQICDNSHNFRPLGLGYANLGALLMSLGLPYDSDAGRAYAAIITAIMHGEAYRQSAIIARDCGAPFPGFALNREPMMEVMRMHADALNQIQTEYVPDYLLQTAREIYQEMLQLGEQYGYRNAQVTVLAPTGCLVGHSLVATEYGLVRLRTLGNPTGEQWQDVDFMVATDEGNQKATKFYINGVAPTRIIRTRSGYTIQGTPNHQIKVIDPATGERVWRRLDAICPGDIVPLQMNNLFGVPREVSLPPLGDLHWNADRALRVPRSVTPELAELVGYYMGDGSLHAKGLRFCVSAQDTDVAERIQELCRSLFGLEPQISRSLKGDYLEIFVHSVPLAIWWEACGFMKHKPHDAHQGKGFTPHIPDAILWTNDPLIYCAFLRGLFEADGSVIAGVPSLTTASETFANEIRTLLLALGYPTTTKVDQSAWGQGTLYVLRLRNRSYNEAFMREIGFWGQRKSGAVARGASKTSGKRDRVYIPLSLVRELVPPTSRHYGAVYLALKRYGSIPRERVLQLLHETGNRRLAELLQFYYDPVVANEDGGTQPTYDLSVPANLTYIANGFVSHNTISFMMDCDTTGIEPDIALVKYKTLVGGGMLKIVNTTVPLALQQLGYSSEQIEAITRYIDEHDTIEGAPYLKEEHLPVFDCAFRPAKGTRSLAPMAHVKMMAAVQPFLSGAISKTVNVPNDATPEDIEQIYMQAWKLGLKAIAIYRDGSKRTQPLSTKKPSEQEAQLPVPTERPIRRHLPDERRSITHKFSIAGHEGYITVGMYEDGTPGEIFITMAKEGSVISGLMDAFATAISLALQYGVPLEKLVEKFSYTRFQPSGFTNNPQIPVATSIVDYIFRWLGMKFLNQQPPQKQPLETLEEQPTPPTASAATQPEAMGITGAKEESSPSLTPTGQGETMDWSQLVKLQQDAPPCPVCGMIMVRAGACHQCLNCGTSYGCS